MTPPRPCSLSQSKIIQKQPKTATKKVAQRQAVELVPGIERGSGSMCALRAHIHSRAWCRQILCGYGITAYPHNNSQKPCPKTMATSPRIAFFVRVRCYPVPAQYFSNQKKGHPGNTWLAGIKICV